MAVKETNPDPREELAPFQHISSSITTVNEPTEFTMETLCLKISPHIHGKHELVLGLSIDEQHGKAAGGLKQAKGLMPPPECQEVTINSLQPRVVVVLQAVTATGSVERVVATIIGDDDVSFGLELTLTQGSGLTIRATTTGVSLVLLTPVLARLATSDGARCRALLEDKTRCPLMKVQSGWCLAHFEQKKLLQDELLDPRKPELDIVEKHLRHRNAPNHENIDRFNTFQEMLALRPIISEVHYAGDWDDGHLAILPPTRHSRGEVALALKTNKSDGCGRVSISSCMARFLEQAEAREYDPRHGHGWRRELTVNLADVRHIRGLHRRRAPDIRNPSVSKLFSNPSVSKLFSNPGSKDSMLSDILLPWADYLGNLPKLPEPVLFDWATMTEEEKERFREANGFGFDRSPEELDW